MTGTSIQNALELHGLTNLAAAQHNLPTAPQPGWHVMTAITTHRMVWQHLLHACALGDEG